MQERMLSPGNIEVHKVLPGEWEKCRELRLVGLQTDRQAFGGSYENESSQDEAYWKERFSDPEKYYYAAKEASKFVSTGALRNMGDNTWMINAVYTLPEFRGKGLSRQIMEKLIEEAQRQGAQTIYLHVTKPQEQAIRLYTQLGFEMVSEEEYKMGDGNMYSLIRMEKKM